MRILMGTTLKPGSRRRGFSNARSHRHPRRHPWQTFTVTARYSSTTAMRMRLLILPFDS